MSEDELTDLIETFIDARPAAERLYADLYARELAQAILGAMA